MGMYDHISVNIDLLPLTEEEKIYWDAGSQTKSMNCNLDVYVISMDQLTKIDLGGKKETSNYTGEIEFYTNLADTNKTWIELKAIFNEGILQYIERIK